MFEILTQCPLFRGLNSEAIAELLGRCTYITNRYAVGELIARRDVVYSGLMIILDGSVRGEITSSCGKRQVIDNIPSGQLIAPAFLFGGYNRLPMDVIANENVRIMTLHRGSLFEMMQDETLVLSNFIDIISNRANFFSRKIYALTVLMLKEKVAQYILGLATDADGEIHINISTMAQVLDLTRPGCEQTLQEIERKGIIKVEGSMIKIINRAALESLV